MESASLPYSRNSFLIADDERDMLTPGFGLEHVAAACPVMRPSATTDKDRRSSVHKLPRIWAADIVMMLRLSREGAERIAQAERLRAGFKAVGEVGIQS